MRTWRAIAFACVIGWAVTAWASVYFIGTWRAEAARQKAEYYRVLEQRIYTHESLTHSNSVLHPR